MKEVKEVKDVSAVDEFFNGINDITVNSSYVGVDGTTDIEAALKQLVDEGISLDDIDSEFYIPESKDANLDSDATEKRKKKQGEIDNELVLQFIMNPTHDNFNKLWTRFYFGVKGHAYKFMHDWDLADDMACQTFTRAWEFKDKYDYTKAKFSTWLYTICRNLCLGELNRKKKDNYIPQDISDIFDSAMLPASAAASTDSTQYIVEKGEIVANDNNDIIARTYNASLMEIDNLGGTYAKILRMKLIDDMKIREIADELDMNESTVKNYLYKGKEAIAEAIKKNHGNLYDMYLDACDDISKII